MKVRQDAWTEENDLLLAETVLRHVREGSTQLNAFEEVGDTLNRTSAACGFRWNAVVRHQYEKALDLAKKQRKQRQRLLGKEQGGKKKLLYQPPIPLEMIESETIEQTSNDVEFSTEAQTELVPLQQSELNLSDVIHYLQQMQTADIQLDLLKSENRRLKTELNELHNEKQELTMKLQSVETQTDTMQEDYETLMKILNRARKHVLFEDDEQTTTFKMDRNGNLEKVAK